MSIATDDVEITVDQHDPREPIEVWLAELEASASSIRAAFGIWRPKTGAYTDRRFYANRVVFIYGALHFLGREDGCEVSQPVWHVRCDWERVDAAARRESVR